MRVTVVGRQREVWRVVLLYIITFGIYRRIWLYRLNKEVDGHASLGLDRRQTLALLILPIIGPSIVTWQTAYRLNTYLHASAPITYGPTWGLWAATLVPILGNGFFLGWTQDRMNIYWGVEKENTKHGIEVDPGLSTDPKFRQAVKAAMPASQRAGSRGDRPSMHDIREERQAVRSLGGSTSVLPWRRPRPEPLRDLDIVCGHCDLEFKATRDLHAATPVVCPRCGTQEVLPSLRGDNVRQRESVMVPALQVDCPKCKTSFHAVRNLDGPTSLRCFKCGHKDTLAAPKIKKA